MGQEKKANMNEFYRKKTVVTFFLSFLVLLIHIHSFDGYDFSGSVGNVLQFIASFLTSGMTGGAIRLFFLISGVLFYRNYSYEKTAEKYQSRFRSLLIPYLLWCTFYTVLFMVAGLTPARGVIAIDMTFSIKNILRGIFLNSYYRSFWFVFNLIIFTLCCPLLYTLLKNKYIGICCISAVSVLYALGITVPETIQIGAEEYVIFWRADSVIFYMIGAYIGIHYFDWFASKKSKKTAILSFAGYILCSRIRMIPGTYDNKAVWLILMLCTCASIWNMFDLIDYDKAPHEVFSYSFMMFALNFYLGVYVAKVLNIVLPKTQIFCLVNLGITITLELVFILGTSHFLSKKAPKFYALITGGR